MELPEGDPQLSDRSADPGRVTGRPDHRFGASPQAPLTARNTTVLLVVFGALAGMCLSADGWLWTPLPLESRILLLWPPLGGLLVGFLRLGRDVAPERTLAEVFRWTCGLYLIWVVALLGFALRESRQELPLWSGPRGGVIDPAFLFFLLIASVPFFTIVGAFQVVGHRLRWVGAEPDSSGAARVPAAAGVDEGGTSPRLPLSERMRRRKLLPDRRYPLTRRGLLRFSILFMVSGTGFFGLMLTMPNIGIGLMVGVPMQVGLLFGFFFLDRRYTRPAVVLMSWWTSAFVYTGWFLVGWLLRILPGGGDREMGVFCFIVMMLPFFILQWVGVVFGHVLRSMDGFEVVRNRKLMGIILLLVPWLCEAAGGWIPFHPPARTIVRERVVEAPREELWKTGIHDPAGLRSDFAGLMHIPLPEASQGHSSSPGNRKRFGYAKGGLEVEVVEAVSPGLLRFRFVRQDKVEARAVDLLGGTMVLEDLGPGRTLVRLELRYRSRCRPQWIVAPCEELFGGLVLSEMLFEHERTWARHRHAGRD